MSKRNTPAKPAAAAGSNKKADSAPAAVVASTPTATTAAAVTPSAPYSGDAAEREIQSLRSEAAELARLRARGQESTLGRLRAAEIAQELPEKLARLKAFRSEQSGIAVAALAVLLIIAVIWVLLGWENPLKWMEQMNKQERHEDMMRHRSG